MGDALLKTGKICKFHYKDGFERIFIAKLKDYVKFNSFLKSEMKSGWESPNLAKNRPGQSA